MHLYVFWRAASVPFIKRHVPPKLIIAIAILLWTFFFIGLEYGHRGAGILAKSLEFLGMNWMAVLFLIFVSLLAVDLVSCFGLILPRIRYLLRGAALIVGCVLSVIALFQGLRPPVVQSYDVQLSNLPAQMDNMKIVALSDLHLDSILQKKWLKKVVAQVQSLQPDLIVLLGDIFEGHGLPHDDFFNELNLLSAPMGVWAVHGNHESYGALDKNGILVKKAGFKLLRNSWIEVRPGFVLAGVDDLTVNRRSGKNDDLIKKALNDRPSGITVLLSHTPSEIDNASNMGADLILCGHTHGGQIWPFGYLVKLKYPFFEGLYKIKNTTVIVTRGAGTWGPKMRLWHPNEILRITLHKKK